MQNKILIDGVLTKDPELRYTGTGKAVCNMRFANNREYTTKDGVHKTDSLFISAVVWGEQAIAVNKDLKKGSRVNIEGHLTMRTWRPEGADKDTVVYEIQVGTIKYTPKTEGPTDGA